MKKVIYNLLLTLMMFSFTSCLTSGLDELDVYDGADITSVSAVAYRYISDEKSPASGQNIVKEVNLTFTSAFYRGTNQSVKWFSDFGCSR